MSYYAVGTDILYIGIIFNGKKNRVAKKIVMQFFYGLGDI